MKRRSILAALLAGALLLALAVRLVDRADFRELAKRDSDRE
jgi:hypothetical protein